MEGRYPCIYPTINTSHEAELRDLQFCVIVLEIRYLDTHLNKIPVAVRSTFVMTRVQLTLTECGAEVASRPRRCKIGLSHHPVNNKRPDTNQSKVGTSLADA